MRILIFTLACCCYLIGSLSSQEKESRGINPFFGEYQTPFQTPPFDLIRTEHYMPAFLEGMNREMKEVDAIVNNPQPPDFKNTIEAFARTGALLEKVDNVFSAVRGANNNDELQKIAVAVSPLESKHSDDINMNEKLFLRVKSIYDGREKLGLNTEQLRLLENTYKGFIRGGANLSSEQKERFRKINEELSMLSLKFNDNVLKETNNFKMVVEKKEDLAGLPQSSIDAAAELDGRWVFTTQKPSMLPFLTFAANRSLREKLYTGYIKRGDNNNEYDNKKIISRIAALRVERSNLLGYKTFADYRLEINMAKTPQAVYDLLRNVWDPAVKVAKKERDDMQSIIDKEGGTFKLASWDWWYYSEKVRKERYDLDENELRPYFQMENVRKGAFDVAHKLYGLQFVERNDIPKYMDEVSVFEVKRSDGSHLGIFYSDYFPRSGKRAGAWCSSFRRQKYVGGKNVTPLIYNVGNFSRPAGDQPALLSLDEVETLFHEFGHALQGLLSNVTYPGLPIARDFVELPSQIMEHWAMEPEVLRTYAFHYKTGDVIPQSLIDKITNSAKFNQGFATVEYLAASFLDMDWHMLTDTGSVDAVAFENQSMGKIGLMPEIVSRYRSMYFSHIIGGYAAGYYSYLWAEVLDSDAFEAFKEKGIFDQATAQSFMKNILERGGSDDPMTLYVKFRGKQPTIEPLLKKRGLM
ncbi:MAG: M3 family peptidase [Ignavibacteriae bacterium]|nr:MAG: M3 family peptidase [Ignavibacteriota bacterium]